MLLKQPSSRALDDEDDDAPIWSPAIRAALDDWHAAKGDGDDAGLKNAAGAIVDATAAYHRVGGVPLFAHQPLPPQFVATELENVSKLPQAQAAQIIGAFVDKFDHGTKPVVAQQVVSAVRKQMTAPPDNEHGEGTPNILATTLQLTPEGARLSNASSFRTASGTTPGSMLESNGRAPSTTPPQRRPQSAPAEEESDFEYGVHTAAYGTDLTLNDLFGEHGWLGDWGKRPVVPRPKGWGGAVGEFVRDVLESGPLPIAGGALSRAALRNLTGEAVLSGTMSAAAEWLTHRNAPDGKKPNYWIAFATGALSPIARAKFAKYRSVSEMVIAMGGSIVNDMVDQEEISVPRAIGAGLAAVVAAQLGDANTQGTVRITLMLLKKVGKEKLAELLGEAVEFTEKEWNEIYQGFQRCRSRQLQREEGGTVPF